MIYPIIIPAFTHIFGLKHFLTNILLLNYIFIPKLQFIRTPQQVLLIYHIFQTLNNLYLHILTKSNNNPNQISES